MRVVMLVLACVAVAWLPAPEPVLGCAPAPRRGEQVEIDSEDALIIWDPVAKVEHFIRRANFKTTAQDFGFLVPTPSRPELAEAGDHIFTMLATATAPPVVYRNEVVTVQRNARSDRGLVKSAAPAPAGRAPTVELLGKYKVAGFDAAVLKADDAKALRDWLEKNGYAVRPELTEWLKWYVENQWIITAFKLTKDPSFADRIAARAVRMTFATETPFYPYREPEDMRSGRTAGSRKLRLFYLSDKKYEGTLGKMGVWPGRNVWSKPTVEGSMKELFNSLNLEEKAKTEAQAKAWHLTEFLDESSPRPGTDEVYFRPAANQEPVEKPPVVVVNYEYRYVDGPSLIFSPIVIFGGLSALAACVVIGYLLRRR